MLGYRIPSMGLVRYIYLYIYYQKSTIHVGIFYRNSPMHPWWIISPLKNPPNLGFSLNTAHLGCPNLYLARLISLAPWRPTPNHRHNCWALRCWRLKQGMLPWVNQFKSFHTWSVLSFQNTRSNPFCVRDHNMTLFTRIISYHLLYF